MDGGRGQLQINPGPSTGDESLAFEMPNGLKSLATAFNSCTEASEHVASWKLHRDFAGLGWGSEVTASPDRWTGRECSAVVLRCSIGKWQFGFRA